MCAWIDSIALVVANDSRSSSASPRRCRVSVSSSPFVEAARRRLVHQRHSLRTRLSPAFAWS